MVENKQEIVTEQHFFVRFFFRFNWVASRSHWSARVCLKNYLKGAKPKLIINLVGFLGGVYMTWQRYAFREEMTPVSCDGSMFVYVIPPQNIMRARVHPIYCTREFYSGTKSRNGMM